MNAAEYAVNLAELIVCLGITAIPFLGAWILLVAFDFVRWFVPRVVNGWRHFRARCAMN